VARVIHEHSAGGVVLVPVGRQTFVALIEVQDGRVLALPKGHLEEGEEAVQTAVREVWEETGLRTKSLAPLGEISYWFYSRRLRARIAKRVEFFLLQYLAGSPEHHNDEVNGVSLVPLHAAAATVSYPGERDVILRAHAHLLGTAGPTPQAANKNDGLLDIAAPPAALGDPSVRP
jgi:8-oxo-dGTP pyrophosphatase MutT (NUDIX family)